MGTQMKDRWGSRRVKQASAAEKKTLKMNMELNRIYIQNIRRINFIRSKYQKCVKAVYGNYYTAKWKVTVIGLTEESNVLKGIKRIMVQVFFSSKLVVLFRTF